MIDWDRLSALRSDIGEDDFADVAQIFVAEIRENLDRLAADPGAAVADDFHFLRGSAANLGFAAMVDGCASAETACHAGEAPDISGLIAIFEASLAEAAPSLPGLADAA